MVSLTRRELPPLVAIFSVLLLGGFKASPSQGRIVLELAEQEFLAQRRHLLAEETRLLLRTLEVDFLSLASTSNGFRIRLAEPARSADIAILRRDLRMPYGGRVSVEYRNRIIDISIPKAESERELAVAMGNVLEVVRARVETMGRVEAQLVQLQGRRYVSLDVPYAVSLAAVEALVTRVGRVSVQAVNVDDSLPAALAGGVPPDSDLLLWIDDGHPQLIRRRVLIRGEGLTHPLVGRETANGTEIICGLTAPARSRMQEWFAANPARPLVLVVDGQIVATGVGEPLAPDAPIVFLTPLSASSARALTTIMASGPFSATVSVAERIEDPANMVRSS